MILQEHLLVMLMEECDEVSQRASKALRFGLREVQKGQQLTNAQRIIYEFNDLIAIMEVLEERALIPRIVDMEAINHKKRKVLEFLEYSKQCGTLTE